MQGLLRNSVLTQCYGTNLINVKKALLVLAYGYAPTAPLVSAYEFNPLAKFGATFADPNTPVPNSAGNGPGDVAFSPDNAYIALCQNSDTGDPLLVVYEWTPNGFGRLMPFPKNPPTTTLADAVAWSPDGQFVAVATNGTDQNVYVWNKGFGERVADPATPLAGRAHGVQWSPDQNYIGWTHNNSPYVSVYNWSSSGYGAKVADPAILPSSGPGSAQGISWSPSGADIIVGSNATPFIYAYPWTGAFGTKYSDPATIPTGQVNSVAFSPDGRYVGCAHNTTPFVSVYPWSSGFGTKVADPGTLPGGQGTGIAWSPEGRFVAITSSAPGILVYPWNVNGTFGTKFADPTPANSGGRGLDWLQM